MIKPRIRKLYSEGNLRRSDPRLRSIYRYFIKLIRASPHDITEIARRSGLNRETIYLWGVQTEPNIASFQAALRVMGYQLAIVPLENNENDKPSLHHQTGERRERHHP